ncbi:MAG TPA: response regulator [Thermoanaerobaculia bacterium]|nr:response regulator [Thermoanaerobaculia bacterium]
MPETEAQARTILIVEDDPDSREVFVELLRDSGYSVIAARNGRDAMTFLSANSPPDAILLDLFMPEMDGWQFRRAQEAEPRLASIPVVVVSAVGAAKNSVVQSGAAAFLQKPVVADDLIRELAKLFVPVPEPAAETAPAIVLPTPADALPKLPS